MLPCSLQCGVLMCCWAAFNRAWCRIMRALHCVFFYYFGPIGQPSCHVFAPLRHGSARFVARGDQATCVVGGHGPAQAQ
jgi:hypothetical protein